jgi:3-oxoadipate enol-lactonase
MVSRGTGAPVILLHGIGSGHPAFRPQIEALAPRFSIYAWDAPGYGRSQDPVTDLTLDDYAGAVLDVLAAIGTSSAHIVGVSWGGVIATRLALNAPRAVSTLSLIGSTVGRAGNPDALADLADRTEALARDGVLAWASRRVDRLLSATASASLRASVLDTMTTSVRLPGFALAAASLAQTDHRGRLREIRAPSIVMAGAEDRVTGLSDAQVLAGGIPRAKLEVIKGAGHLANQERPLTVNTVLERLLMCEERNG